MNEQDKKSFAALLITMGEIYQMPIKRNISELYWQALKPYPWEQVKAALQQHFFHPEQGRYFPKPADIIGLFQEKIKEQAEDAWEKVERAIRELGVYRTVAFDDPIIHCVLNQLCGWVRLCQATQQELASYAKRFQTLYQKIANQNSLPNYPAYFCGLLEVNNFEETKPTYVGNKAKALTVTEQEQSNLSNKLAKE